MWFRYHRLFADLLQLELRRTEPDEVAGLHRAAAQWLAGHEYPMEAVRHALAGQDWGLAARLLSDHWSEEYLSGRGSTLDELLARFPGEAVAADAELIAVRVAGDLIRGSLDEAERDLALAASALPSVAADRRRRLQPMLSVLRFFLARRRMDFPVVAEEARRLLALMETDGDARLGLGEDLRAVTLISLGAAEIWALRFSDAEWHLEQRVDLARRTGRPHLEFTGLTYWAHGMMLFRPDGLQTTRAGQAVELAEQHGWGEESLAGIAYTVLAGMLLYQGRLTDAEPWLERAERALNAEVEPAAGMSLRFARAVVLEMVRGRYPQAPAAFGAAERLAAELGRPHTTVISMRAQIVQALVRAGQADRAAAVLAGLDSGERASPEMRTATAALQLARGDAQAAADVLAPVLDGSIPGVRRPRMMTALLLQARARDALGDRAAAGRALEQARDIAESTGIPLPFLLDPPGDGEAGSPPVSGGVPGVRGGGQPSREQGVWGGSFPPASRTSHRQRDPHPALPADSPDRAGDRPRAVGVGAHRHHPPASPVRQARRAPPPPGRGAGPRPGPAGPHPAERLRHAAPGPDHIT